MKFQLICLLFILSLLSGCNPALIKPGGGDNLELAEHTNEIAQSNLNLGLAYMQRGEYEKALEKLERALDADSKYTPTLNALALLHQKLGKMDKAEEYFKRALSIRANDPYTLNNYGQFLCIGGRFKEAEDAFLKSAGNPLYETPEIAYANAGTCSLKNNEQEKAEIYLRKALEKNPKLAVALLQMSQISYDKGSYLSARGYLQRYLEVANHTPVSLWLGIQIEQQLGDKDTVSSYALLLKNNFPNSKEAELLHEAGIK